MNVGLETPAIPEPEVVVHLTLDEAEALYVHVISDARRLDGAVGELYSNLLRCLKAAGRRP